MVSIRKIEEKDFRQLWPVFLRVIETRESWPQLPSIQENEARDLWLKSPVTSFVAESDGQLAGAYLLRPNQVGFGSHVANAGYLVDTAFRRQGIGELLGRHSISEARRQGYLSMQLNLVVSTNLPAVALWQKIGFKIIGTLPGAFLHGTKGFVDAYIMFLELGSR